MNATWMIRKEQTEDYSEVEALVTAAFEGAEHSDGNEALLVRALRKSGSFVPALSLVAVSEEGRIIGHILFTEVRIGPNTALALAPLSVHPDFQRKGVGTALIGQGHHAAQNMGYDVSVVLGDPAYYHRQGYIPAATFGITAPFDVPSEYYMAYLLNTHRHAPQGTVGYDAAFGIPAP